MTPEEESVLLKRVEELTVELRTLREELDLYRINGLADMFSGKGNQTFGGGIMRLDRNGMQVQSLGNTNEIPAIYFVEEFSNDPDLISVKAKLQGRLYSGSSVNISTTAESVDSSARFGVYSSDNYESAVSFELLQNNDYVNAVYFTAKAYPSGAGNYFSFVGGFLLLPSKSTDFASPIDGSIWFHTVDKVIRFYTINGTETIATREWATDILSGIQYGGDGSTLTISSGEVTISSTYHTIDTESAAATDNLDYIYGPSFNGQLLMLRAANSARTVVLKDGTGNLKLAGDMSLDNAEDTITLLYDLNNDLWYEITRSNNGA